MPSASTTPCAVALPVTGQRVEVSEVELDRCPVGREARGHVRVDVVGAGDGRRARPRDDRRLCTASVRSREIRLGRAANASSVPGLVARMSLKPDGGGVRDDVVGSWSPRQRERGEDRRCGSVHRSIQSRGPID